MTKEEDQLAEFQQWINEPLDPELVPWVEEGGFGGRSLKHPLVFDLGLTLPGRCNRALVEKRKALVQAIDDEDWYTVVFLHERPYRTDALIDHIVGRDWDGQPLPLVNHDDEVRDLAATVWRDSDNLQQSVDEWRAMLQPGDAAGLVLLDCPKEDWDALPDPLTLYRGDIDDGGFSWTTRRETAEWFANRFDAGMDLVVGTVAKKDVVGYLTGRGEYEVLVLDPDAVAVHKRLKVRSDYVE